MSIEFQPSTITGKKKFQSILFTGDTLKEGTTLVNAGTPVKLIKKVQKVGYEGANQSTTDYKIPQVFYMFPDIGVTTIYPQSEFSNGYLNGDDFIDTFQSGKFQTAKYAIRWYIDSGSVQYDLVRVNGVSDANIVIIPTTTRVSLQRYGRYSSSNLKYDSIYPNDDMIRKISHILGYAGNDRIPVFRYDNIDSILIPINVKEIKQIYVEESDTDFSIGEGAFCNCPYLNFVYVGNGCSSLSYKFNNENSGYTLALTRSAFEPKYFNECMEDTRLTIRIPDGCTLDARTFWGRYYKKESAYFQQKIDIIYEGSMDSYLKTAKNPLFGTGSGNYFEFSKTPAVSIQRESRIITTDHVYCDPNLNNDWNWQPIKGKEG